MREGRRGRRPGSSGALSQLLLLITSLQTLSAAEIIRYDGDVNIGKSIGKLNLKCDKSSQISQIQNMSRPKDYSEFLLILQSVFV